MKLNTFEKIIRKVIREEIDYALKREITTLREEIQKLPQQPFNPPQTPDPQVTMGLRDKLKTKFTPPTFNSGDDTLDGLLNETAQNYVDPNTINPQDPVSQFINKDYTELMGAIENKKTFRP